MNHASPPQRNARRKFLVYLVAFIITVVVTTGISHLRGFSSPYPSGALIVETQGHNSEAMAALRNAGIPTLTVIDASTVEPTPFLASLIWTTCYLALVFAGFFGVTALFKRFLG